MKVIFGDDFDGAKEKFLALLEKTRSSSEDVAWYQAKDLDLSRISELLSGTDLFGEKKTVFLEMLSGAFRGKKATDLKLLLKDQDTKKLIVLEEKFDGRFYQGLDVEKIEVKLPAHIFAYLDSIGGSSSTVLRAYTAVVLNEPVEKVFRMTVLRLQDLIRIKSNPRKYDLGKFYWKKIYQQSQRISFENLYTLYEHLYLIEKEIKTGTSPLDMGTRFELFWQLYRL